jgi:adenylylsulfate kinase
MVLDGDNVRHGLCGDLGFSPEDRKENLRRVGELTKLFVEAGMITLTAFISPYRNERRLVRGLLPHGDFIEVYCNSPLEICEQRDVKGLYGRARAGEIKEFTGISAPYEEPEKAELVLNTGTTALTDTVTQVLALLEERGLFLKDTAIER